MKIRLFYYLTFQRDSTPLARRTTIQIYTFALASMCGETLTVGRRYLIFGKIQFMKKLPI